MRYIKNKNKKIIKVTVQVTCIHNRPHNSKVGRNQTLLVLYVEEFQYSMKSMSIKNIPQVQHNLGFHMWCEEDQHPTQGYK